MRPDTSHLRPQDEAPTQPAPAGVTHRPHGQARAVQRAAAYRGFTRAVPSVTAAGEILLATANDGGLGLAPIGTLIALLRQLPARRWRETPVLRLSNQRIADAVGCCSRTVQRHLKRLHEQGVIAIGWGPGNTRLPFRQDGSSEAEWVGIDLRPALVFASEMADRQQSRRTALHAFDTARAAASTAILVARGALEAARALLPIVVAAHRQQLTELRQALQATACLAHQPTATILAIEAATARVRALGVEAKALGHVPDHEPDPPGGGGERGEDKAGDNAFGVSPGYDGRADQETESTGVESLVLTDQRAGQAPAKGWRLGSGADDLAAPLLYGRWLGAYNGARPLPSDALVELEIAARLRARAMGLATRVVNQAVARHGVGLVIGAVLHVSSLPETAQVRSRGGLLASLLRREVGQLTPDTFHRRLLADPELGEAEALGIASRLAPSHRPYWVLGRWHATCRRKGEPIRHPRGCLAAFARKLEQEQGRGRCVS